MRARLSRVAPLRITHALQPDASLYLHYRRPGANPATTRVSPQPRVRNTAPMRGARRVAVAPLHAGKSDRALVVAPNPRVRTCRARRSPSGDTDPDRSPAPATRTLGTEPRASWSDPRATPAPASGNVHCHHPTDRASRADPRHTLRVSPRRTGTILEMPIASPESCLWKDYSTDRRGTPPPCQQQLSWGGLRDRGRGIDEACAVDPADDAVQWQGLVCSCPIHLHLPDATVHGVFDSKRGARE